MLDLHVTPFTFQSTEVTVEPVSEKGKTFFAEMFGKGAVSVNMRKSNFLDFELFATRKGFSFS